MGTSRADHAADAVAGVSRNATDEDLKAIFAYLRTIKPITNHVPDVQPPATLVAQAR